VQKVERRMLWEGVPEWSLRDGEERGKPDQDWIVGGDGVLFVVLISGLCSHAKGSLRVVMA
jgi:hypothetical protein